MALKQNSSLRSCMLCNCFASRNMPSKPQQVQRVVTEADCPPPRPPSSVLPPSRPCPNPSKAVRRSLLAVGDVFFSLRGPPRHARTVLRCSQTRTHEVAFVFLFLLLLLLLCSPRAFSKKCDSATLLRSLNVGAWPCTASPERDRHSGLCPSVFLSRAAPMRLRFARFALFFIRRELLKKMR